MNKTTKTLTQLSYLCWTIGIIVAIYLAVGDQKNNVLTGLSFGLIILGIVVSVIKDRKISR